jgi:hypothetical protein
MSITVKGGSVTKGHNVVAKDKTGKTKAVYDKKGKKTVVPDDQTGFSSTPNTPPPVVPFNSHEPRVSNSPPINSSLPGTQPNPMVGVQPLLNPGLALDPAVQAPTNPPQDNIITFNDMLRTTLQDTAWGKNNPEFFQDLNANPNNLISGIGPMSAGGAVAKTAVKASTKANALIAALDNDFIGTIAKMPTSKTIGGKTIDINSFRIGQAAETMRNGRVTAAVNTLTKKQMKKILTIAGFSVAGALYLTKESLSGKVFGDFQLAEAIDKIAYARRKASEEDRDDLVLQLNMLEDEITNPSNWDNFVSYIPWIGANVGTKKNIEAGKLASNVYKQLEADNKIQRETGETDDEKYARIAVQKENKKIADHKEAEDYYKEIAKQRAEAKAADHKEAEAYYAKIYAEKDKKMSEYEKANDAYWLEYYRIQDKLRANNTPSNLKFGLL